MRVCIVQNVSLADHLALSTYLTSIVKYLDRQSDLELILITCKGSRPIPEMWKHLEIREIPSDLYSVQGNLGFSRKVFNELRNIESEGHLDVVHCLYPFSSLMGASLFKHRCPKTRIVYDIRSPWIDMSVERGSIPRPLGKAYRTSAYCFESVLSDNADGLIFITEGLQRHYETKIRLRERPHSTIPSGIDLDHFIGSDGTAIRKKYGIEDDEVVLGYVGGVSNMRELDFVIKGFKDARRERKDIRLMIVGDGNDLVRLRGMAENDGNGDDIVFTGRVDFNEIPEYISALDIGLCHLPDKMVFRYSFPMKILEYLACGVGVIASDINAHREIANSVPGIEIYGNIESFVSSLCKIGRRDMRKFSGLERYDWTQICSSIRELWDQTLERGT